MPSARKLRRVCELLELGPDDHVLEIGCGWGSFAAHGGRGVRRARDRADALGGAGAPSRVRAGVDVRLPGLPHGRGAVHEDRVDRDARGDRPRAVPDLLPRDRPAARPRRPRVRPGDRDARTSATSATAATTTGSAATSSRGRCSRRSGARAGDGAARRFGLASVDDIGPDYAPTLQAWRERFLARLDDVRRLGYDERFVRTWEFYLAYCEAAFRTRSIRDVQLVVTRISGTEGVRH